MWSCKELRKQSRKRSDQEGLFVHLDGTFMVFCRCALYMLVDGSEDRERKDMKSAPPSKVQSGAGSYSTPTSEDVLNPSLWEQLPREVLQLVLTKLPLSSLRKFSRVSKQWKALFRSEEFGRACDSEEATVYYCDLRKLCTPYMLLLNLEKKSWDKHSLEFISLDEMVDDRVAADHGLLCYRIWKKGFGSSVILVVQNPLTRKFRRLVAPYELKRSWKDETLWGLIMDQKTGNYKVVIRFFSENLIRQTFIYDSSSKSWSESAAAPPVLVPHVRDGFKPECWGVRSRICSGGELIWLVEEIGYDRFDENLLFKWLVKYNLERDEWSMARQQPPLVCCAEVQLVHHAGENRPFMVNLFDINPTLCDRYLPRDCRFPEEFLRLVPNMGKFGLEDIRLLVEQAGYKEFPDRLEHSLVARSDEIWWFLVPRIARSSSYRSCMDIFALSSNPPKVIRFPELVDQDINRLVPFVATLKAFV